MQNDDLGLPQCDFDAPRMLAHTFLFEIDGLLKDYPGVEFARYMDDIDIGVNDMATAKRVLRDLDLTLQSRHIRLNSGKTKILTASRALEHFCVAENRLLDLLEAKVKKNLSRNLDIVQQVLMFGWLIKRWNTSGVFGRGNGSKILKRLVNYSRLYGSTLDSSVFYKYFIDVPALRETLLRYVSRTIDPIDYVKTIDKILASGQIVDDVSVLRIATALVTARYTKRLPPVLISSIINRLDRKAPFSLLAAMLLVSRFQSYKELRKLIDNGEYVWRTEPMVTRAVAGFLPYFRGHRDFGPVSKRLAIIGGRSANDALSFENDYVFGDEFSKIRNFIKSPNPSYVNGVTHAKFGMIFGFLSNGSFTKADKLRLLSNHTMLQGDVYYKSLVVAKLKSIP